MQLMPAIDTEEESTDQSARQGVSPLPLLRALFLIMHTQPVLGLPELQSRVYVPSHGPLL